ARSEGEIVAFNVLIVAPLMFVFGDAMPKELFRNDADRLTYRFAWPLTWLRSLLSVTGVIPALMGIARLIERALRIPSDNSHIADARQRLAVLLKEGSDGVLSASQSTLIDRALTFRSTLIGEEMIPWAQVRTLSIDWDRARLVRFASAQPSSRLPVVDSKGRVLGVLRQIDLHTFPEAPIESLLRRPAMLSPSMGVLEALRRIQAADAPLGIVERDARLVGLVTAKDLVEPLTGELPDW
ncbi:MAG: CBS domain-containing protein, partial [Phycisphaerae bacterium]|nr:CBS domain-containing protein [Phycisphaerae bacterium]